MRMLVIAAVLLVSGCAAIPSGPPVCAATDAACLDNQVFLQRYYKVRADAQWQREKARFLNE